jgi:hypothetical protein
MSGYHVHMLLLLQLFNSHGMSHSVAATCMFVHRRLQLQCRLRLEELALLAGTSKLCALQRGNAWLIGLSHQDLRHTLCQSTNSIAELAMPHVHLFWLSGCVAICIRCCTLGTCSRQRTGDRCLAVPSLDGQWQRPWQTQDSGS